MLQVRGAGALTLFSDEGKPVGRATVKGCRGMPEGAELQLASWEVEVQTPLPESRFLSGEVFMAASAPIIVPAALQHAKAAAAKPAPATAAPFRAVGAGGADAAAAAAVPNPRLAQPLHDPAAPNALVLCAAGDARFSGRPGGAACAVVVDPYIASRLRPHQREGVSFMFEAVMGARGAQHSGCLLADAMGVGKTLQVLALAWTLLRQSPGGGGVPSLRRVVVVCPATLVANWKAEAAKWLGAERLGVLALQGGGGAAAVKEAAAGWAAKSQNRWPMLVLSYETLRTCAAEVAAAAPGLLICDEAHRLKSAGGSKTLAALRSLAAKRRVLLTGTPVQNNLEEFFAMMDFATPGLLGDASGFRRLFAGPIAASRDASASAEAKRVGAERAVQLSRLAAPFMLRRTADVNSKYLPPKQDYVVFCRPSQQQAVLYAAFLKLPEMREMLTGCGGNGSGPLSPLVAITLLRRLCASPDALLGGAVDEAEGDDEAAAGAARGNGGGSGASARVVAALRAATPAPPAAADAATTMAAASGKMAALAAILRRVASVPGDRVVVVAGWTSTLDAVAQLCAALALQSSRLDGSTPIDARADVVRRFNGGSGGVVFLLSTRAGGVGINLCGANRLVLFDSDWNPAHDAQALGRVWRDGQRKPVALYRLLTSGSIEEKIYQRQLLKGEMAALVQAEAASRHFSAEELRRLFAFRPPAAGAQGCETAELLAGGAGGAALAAQWRDVAADVDDAPLADAVASGCVSYVYAPPADGSAAALAAAAEAVAADVDAARQADVDEADAEAARAAAGDLSMWADDDDDEDSVDEGPIADDAAAEAEAELEGGPQRRRLRRKADVEGGGTASTAAPFDDDDDDDA